MPETVDIALGRRKRSIARVRFIKGKGNILINDREVSDYFKRPSLVMELKEPLSIVEFDNKDTEQAIQDNVVNIYQHLYSKSFCAILRNYFKFK